MKRPRLFYAQVLNILAEVQEESFSKKLIEGECGQKEATDTFPDLSVSDEFPEAGTQRSGNGFHLKRA